MQRHLHRGHHVVMIKRLNELVKQWGLGAEVTGICTGARQIPRTCMAAGVARYGTQA